MKSQRFPWKRFFLSALLLTLALVALLLVLGTGGAAEENARLYGTVREQGSGNSIEARIDVSDPSQGLSNYTESTALGSYEIKLSPGNYTITIFSSGYVPIRGALAVEVSIGDGDDVEHNFNLTPAVVSISLSEEDGKSSLEGKAGEKISFYLWVVNIGNGIDAFKVSCPNLMSLENKGFSISIVPAVTGDVHPLNHSAVKVTVKLPDKAGSHHLEFQAMSDLHSGPEKGTFIISVMVEEKDDAAPALAVIGFVFVVGGYFIHQSTSIKGDEEQRKGFREAMEGC